MFGRSICRAVALARPLVAARVAPVTAFRATAVRSFALSVPRFAHAEVDRDLTQKLNEELTYEKEQSEEQPAFVKEFLSKSPFKIEEKPGSKEVTLVRSFGNEKISAIFSTDALAEPDFEDYEGEEERSPAIPVTIIIEKKSGNTGALEINATSQDDAFFIENVTFSPSASLLTDQNAEADFQRRTFYSGPVFEELDEGLQELFLRFLSERGFDENLSAFISQYTEAKEQKEYMSWLENVGKFVQA
ncbi:Mitochondrial acidic protein mam33 [Borealophlyctis nickersoniae]|nr:Mitochondrial acidic protein mam33 [Borealophlyctis nickersoniae]